MNISTISATANSDWPTPKKLNSEFTTYYKLSVTLMTVIMTDPSTVPNPTNKTRTTGNTTV